jgi:hypothetical protein
MPTNPIAPLPNNLAQAREILEKDFPTYREYAIQYNALTRFGLDKFVGDDVELFEEFLERMITTDAKESVLKFIKLSGGSPAKPSRDDAMLQEIYSRMHFPNLLRCTDLNAETLEKKVLNQFGGSAIAGIIATLIAEGRLNHSQRDGTVTINQNNLDNVAAGLI